MIYYYSGAIFFLFCWSNSLIFWQRKLPSPGFQVEIVMIDYDGTTPSKTRNDDNHITKGTDGKLGDASASSQSTGNTQQSIASRKQKNEDDVFSDSEGEEEPRVSAAPNSETGAKSEHISSVSHQTENLSLGREPTNSKSKTSHEVKTEGGERNSTTIPNLDSTDIKAIAADASVFSFGDDEDDESE